MRYLGINRASFLVGGLGEDAADSKSERLIIVIGARADVAATDEGIGAVGSRVQRRGPPARVRALIVEAIAARTEIAGGEGEEGIGAGTRSCITGPDTGASWLEVAHIISIK